MAEHSDTKKKKNNIGCSANNANNKYQRPDLLTVSHHQLQNSMSQRARRLNLDVSSIHLEQMDVTLHKSIYH